MAAPHRAPPRRGEVTYKKEKIIRQQSTEIKRYILSILCKVNYAKEYFITLFYKRKTPSKINYYIIFLKYYMNGSFVHTQSTAVESVNCTVTQVYWIFSNLPLC